MPGRSRWASWLKEGAATVCTAVSQQVLSDFPLRANQVLLMYRMHLSFKKSFSIHDPTTAAHESLHVMSSLIRGRGVGRSARGTTSSTSATASLPSDPSSLTMAGS